MPILILLVALLLLAYAAYGIADAFLRTYPGIAHWLRYPDAFRVTAYALDAAALALAVAALTLLWAAARLPSPRAYGPDLSEERPSAPLSPWRVTLLPLIALLIVSPAGVVVGVWGPLAVPSMLVGWLVALATVGAATAPSVRRARLPRRTHSAANLYKAALLAIVGSAVFAGAYYGADAAMRSAWQERNTAFMATLPVYPEAARHAVRTDYGPFAVRVGGGVEARTGIVLTRWWPAGVAYGSTAAYRAPAGTTSRRLMRWYREELGAGWEWELTRLDVVRDGEQVGVLVEGSADRDNISLSFWNDGLAYGADDPNARSETSYEIVVWNRPRGVSY